MRQYFYLVSVWLVCSVGPLFAGDYWDDHFFLLQAFTSLLILQGVVWLIPGRSLWRGELIAVLFLQIAHNAGAYYSSVWHPVSSLNDLSMNYDRIHLALNLAEMVFLFWFGGRATYRGWKYGRHTFDSGNSKSRNNARSGPEGKQAHV